MSGPLPGLVEMAINRALALDPAVLARLVALAPTVVAIATPGLPEVGVAPHAGGLTLVPAGDAVGRVSGSVPALLEFFLRGDTPRVQVTGDGAAVAALTLALRGARPDLEDALARVAGDIPARRAAQAARTTRTQLRGVGDGLLQTLGEFVHYEQPILPSPEEYAAFCADIAQLRAGLDALHARLEAAAAKPDA